jgi:hypothetical protein
VPQATDQSLRGLVLVVVGPVVVVVVVLVVVRVVLVPGVVGHEAGPA